MRIRMLPSSVSGDLQNQFLTTYLINESIAIDAGSLGFHGSPQIQAKIKHVLLTHTHMDHLASLPIFVENAYEGSPDCVTIYGSDHVLDCLKQDVFNDRVWPDLLRISPPDAPFMRLERLESGRPLEIEGVRITPVSVDHIVPSLGLIIEEPGAAVAIIGDTGPTEEIWQKARETPYLKAVFLEAAFPNSMTGMAHVSKHMTPELFGGEAGKLRGDVRFLVVHIKPKFFGEITAELDALGLENVGICRAGQVYEYG